MITKAVEGVVVGIHGGTTIKIGAGEKIFSNKTGFKRGDKVSIGICPIHRTIIYLSLIDLTPENTEPHKELELILNEGF